MGINLSFSDTGNHSDEGDGFGPNRRPMGTANPYLQQPPVPPQPAELPPQQQPHDWGYSPNQHNSERESYEMRNQQQQQQQKEALTINDLSTTSGFFDQVILGIAFQQAACSNQCNRLTD